MTFIIITIIEAAALAAILGTYVYRKLAAARRTERREIYERGFGEGRENGYRSGYIAGRRVAANDAVRFEETMRYCGIEDVDKLRIKN